MSNAIITIAKNLPPWFADIVLPRMANYAARCGAELVVIEPPEWRGMATRMCTAEHVAKHDRSLVLDADVVISREAPNIFDLFPEGAAYAASDSEPGDPDAMRQWPIITQVQAVCGARRWTKGYHNTGVVLCDRYHATAWTDWPDFPAFLCPDQAALNWRLRVQNDKPLKTLPREWNAFGLNSPNIRDEFTARNVATDEIVHIARQTAEELGYNHLSRIPDICHGAHIAHMAGFAEPERSEAMRIANEIMP